jgi:hypothetical protein
VLVNLVLPALLPSSLLVPLFSPIARLTDVLVDVAIAACSVPGQGLVRHSMAKNGI